MELIVAVYKDWGIGRDGTQPVTLGADRAFFRQTTRGATVIVGRRTAQDFPGQKPLPGRENIVLSTKVTQMDGFTVCSSVEQVLALTEKAERTMVIGGGAVYRQLLPYCNKAYVTKLSCAPESDTFFPDLDKDPGWEMTDILEAGTENGIDYQMCLYERK